MSEDPCKRGTNWYDYCHESPIGFVDRSGEDEDIVSVEAGMSITAYLNTWVTTLGYKILAGAVAFEVEGQILTDNARYIVRNLIEDCGRRGSVDDFSMWAVETMGGAGQQFLKAWLSVNLEEETALFCIVDDGTEIFQSHRTPYVGGLRRY